MEDPFSDYSLDKWMLQPDKIPLWRRGMGLSLTPSWEGIDNRQLLGEGKSVFFMGVDLGGLPTLQGMAIHSRIYGQHKLDLMVLENNEDSESGGQGRGEDLEEVGRGGSNVKNLLYEILKDQIYIYICVIYKMLHNVIKYVI